MIFNKLKTKYIAMPIQARAALWFLMCSFLQKGISMISTPIFTRLLNSAEFGQYNVFNSWLSILTIFVSMNLSMGVYTTGLIKFEEERAELSSSLQTLTLVLVLVWTIIYLCLHTFWNELIGLSTIQMLFLLVIIWTTSVFRFWASEQRVQYKYKTLVTVTIIASVLKPTVSALFVIISTDKVTARILGIMLVELLMYSWCFFIQIKKGGSFFSAKHWRYALAYNLPLIPHYLSQTILNSSDRIMIERMIGSSEAGIYSLAYSLAMIVTLFSQALTQTLNPWFYQKIKQKKISDFNEVSYVSLGIIASAIAFLMILAPEAVYIFAPKQYSDAIYCIPPVCMGMYFLFMYEIFGKFAFYYGKTKLIMLASVLSAIVNVLLNYVGIHKFGYIAAAYTTLICYILFSVFHYILMRKICKDYLDNEYPLDLRLLLFFSILFVCFGLLILFTYRNVFLRYSIILVLFIFAFCFRRKIFMKVKGILQIKRQNKFGNLK